MEAISEPAGRTRAFDALKHRDFRLLWTGQTISLIGDTAFLTALGWKTFTVAGSGKLGLVLAASGLIVALAVRRNTPSLGVAAYAAIVIAIPIVGGTLLRAVGDDRSSAPVTDAVAAALSRSAAAGAPAQVVGIGAFIPSLPFYLRRTIPLATATAKELTSTYIADYADRFRTLPGSPLLDADAWRDLLSRCPLPTIFIARAGDRDVRTTLHGRLPLLGEDARFAAYGPCRGGR